MQLILLAIRLVFAYTVLHSTNGIDYTIRGVINNSILSTPKLEIDTTQSPRYYVKLVQAENELVSSIPTSLFKSSDFKDKFIIHLDGSLQIYHLDYLVQSSYNHAESEGMIVMMTNFVSVVVVQEEIRGSRPVLLLPILKDDKVEGLESSFIIKYWYIILPATLILMLASVEAK